MKTVKELVLEQKCRKGQSSGTTKRGAYWVCGKPAEIRAYGGDGIGNNPGTVQHLLEVRHFRDGDVRAVVHRKLWHQNGESHSYQDVFNILSCATIEDVVVELKGTSINECHAYSDGAHGNLVAMCEKLGLPLSAPAPDEEGEFHPVKVVIDKVSGGASGISVDVDLHHEDRDGTRDGFETIRVILHRDRTFKADGTVNQEAISAQAEEYMRGVYPQSEIAWGK